MVSDENKEVSNEQATTEEVDNQEIESTETDENSKEEATESTEEAKAEAAEEAFTKVNPEELPDELKAVYKSMQADYVRKTQEVREVREKAKLYDQYQQEQMIQRKFPQEVVKATPQTRNFLAESLGVDVSTLSPEERQQFEVLAKGVDAVVLQRINEYVAPIQSKMTYKEYQQELLDTKKKYADFDQYAPAIRSLTEANPQMSYEQAYMIASYEDREKAGRTSALKNLEVKKKQAAPKSTAQAKESDEPASDFASIFNWAKKRSTS